MKIQIKGLTGGRDRRGMITVKAKCLFTESSIDEALLAPLPVGINLPESGGRTFVEWVDHTSFIIEATFEGIIEDPAANEEQAQIVGEWREEPIEAFPFRELLESQYGAYEEDGRLKFPQYLDSGARSSGSGLGGATGREIENPLFGTTTYPVQRLVATHSYVRLNVPPSVYSKAGTIVKTLPSRFDNPPKRTWMVDSPQVRAKGNAWEIAEKYKEVDNLKHIEALYLLLQKKRK